MAAAGFCSEGKLSELQKQARTYRIQGFALQQENPEAAIPYYQKALALDPGYVVAYNDLGIIFESLGDKERAARMYLEAIKTSPDYPNSYSNLALLYEEEEDYAKAIHYWGIRATLGYSFDPWAIEARKRVEEISRTYPETKSYIPEQYKEKVARQERLVRIAEEETKLQDKIKELKREIEEMHAFREEISRVDSGIEKETVLEARKAVPRAPHKPAAAATQVPISPEKQKWDGKIRARDYLESAKENFSKREYVLALKEATVAGYLDPSNSEISDFVEKVRKALLQ